MTPLQRLREAAEETGWAVEQAPGWLAILNADGGLVVGIKAAHSWRRITSPDGFTVDIELMELLLEAAQ